MVSIIDVFNAIQSVHEELGHAGKNQTATTVLRSYYGISKAEVDWLLAHCNISSLNQ